MQQTSNLTPSFFTQIRSITLTKKQVAVFLGVTCLFAFLIRITSGYYIIHTFDLVDYYYEWVTGLQQGLFTAYENIENLDYPPVLLFFLYPLSFFVKTPIGQNVMPILMLQLKIVTILFDIAIIPAIYFCLKKYSPVLALLASLTWAFSPVAIFDSSYWGQTDSIMIFSLLIAFTLLNSNRLFAATMVYTLACLTKFQCLYFAPVFLLFMFFSKYKVKDILISIGSGLAAILVIFFPFMLKSGFDLPFKIYFGGHGKYPWANLNAFNLYGLLGLNYVDDRAPFFGSISLGTVSMMITLLIIALIALLFFKAKNKCPFILGFLMMQSIFMFTTRMHERYQIPVLIFILAASLKHHHKKLFYNYIALSIVTFFNQSLLFTKVVIPYDAPWINYFNVIMIVFSAINIILYFTSFYQCLDILFTQKQNLDEDAQIDGFYDTNRIEVDIQNKI